MNNLELQNIEILAKNGLLHFNDITGKMRESGSVKFIYNLESDADLITAFYYGYLEMVDQLAGDGINVISGIELGNLNANNPKMKMLKNTNNLVKLLQDNGENYNRIIITPNGKNTEIVSVEDGANMTYGDLNQHKTLIGKFMGFACALNKSREINSAKNANELRKYISEKYSTLVK